MLIPNKEKRKLFEDPVCLKIGTNQLSFRIKTKPMNKPSFILRIILLVLFVLGITPQITKSQSTSIQNKFIEWQKTPELAHTSICVNVTDNQTGEEIIGTSPQVSLVPASIFKVITTATALDVLGPDFRFNTQLSYSGILRNDTLLGDLQIIGGGDPTLNSSYFPENGSVIEKWLDAIRQKNIKVITGNLIVDGTAYESQGISDTWAWEDLGCAYGAGTSGISFCDNMFEIHLSSEKIAEKPTQIVKIIPEIPNLEIQNEVLSSDIDGDHSCIFGRAEENKRIIRGTIPKNKTDFVINASTPNPAALLANELRKKLSGNGIIISGQSLFGKAKSGENQSTLISLIQSPSLREIIKVTNYESVNLFAEHFLKQLAFQKNGLGTIKDGCKIITEFWKEKGLDMNGFFMTDGCGLSRFDGVTARQMVDVLRYMKTQSAYSDDFIQSLPSAGNGTLSAFRPEDFPNQCLHAKSGSMTRVRCYAGYLTTTSGRQLSFAIMLNNFSCNSSEAGKKIRELLIELRKM